MSGFHTKTLWPDINSVFLLNRCCEDNITQMLCLHAVAVMENITITTAIRGFKESDAR